MDVSIAQPEVVMERNVIFVEHVTPKEGIQKKQRSLSCFFNVFIKLLCNISNSYTGNKHRT